MCMYVALLGKRLLPLFIVVRTAILSCVPRHPLFCWVEAYLVWWEWQCCTRAKAAVISLLKFSFYPLIGEYVGLVRVARPYVLGDGLGLTGPCALWSVLLGV